MNLKFRFRSKPQPEEVDPTPKSLASADDTGDTSTQLPIAAVVHRAHLDSPNGKNLEISPGFSISRGKSPGTGKSSKTPGTGKSSKKDKSTKRSAKKEKSSSSSYESNSTIDHDLPRFDPQPEWRPAKFLVEVPAEGELDRAPSFGLGSGVESKSSDSGGGGFFG